MKNQPPFAERRHYVRLETVFPVEFKICSKKTPQRESFLKQGFTRNVSEGGLCLEVNELDTGLAEEIVSGDSIINLYINLPHHDTPIKATASTRWNKKIKDGYPSKYLFGVEYIEIEAVAKKEIINYARKKNRMPKIIFSTVSVLLAFCALLILQTHDLLIKKNVTEKQLLSLGEELTRAYESRTEMENKMYSLNIKKQKLIKDMRESRNVIDSLNKRLVRMASLGNNISDELTAQKVKLEKDLSRWQEERKILLKQLKDLSVDKETLNEELHSTKNLSNVKIVRLRLTNGSSIVGQLLDVTADRIDVKIGMGSIGIERSLITNISELSDVEKIDIQSEWRRQEEEARIAEEKYNLYLSAQHRKGLVYYNGKWITQKKARQIDTAMSRKEDAVLNLLASRYGDQSITPAKTNIWATLIGAEPIPVVSTIGRRLYLDGKLFFIKGVGYGIEYPGTSGGMETFKKVPDSVFVTDFKLMKAAGINTIRTYEPLPDRLLDLAEQYGIMVIENVCYPSGNTDFNSRVHLEILKEKIRKYVLRDKGRKCILMWSIWNDAPWSWGVNGNVVKKYGFEKVNNFLFELYKTAKKYDSSRPVTASNAMGLEGDSLGWDFLDVIGLNLYLGGFDWFIEEDAGKQIEAIKKMESKYKKPVVIMETGFSTFVEGQDQAEVLEKQIKFAGTSVSGITIFQWADGWAKAGNKDKLDPDIEEHWGILDGYRNPKPGFRVVSSMFNSIPTESYGYNDEKVRKN